MKLVDKATHDDREAADRQALEDACKSGAERGAAAREITNTDLANNRRLLEQYGDVMRYTNERGWFINDGKRWAPNKAQAARNAKDVARNVYDEIKDARDDQKKILFKWAKASQNVAQIKAMLALAESDRDYSYTDFDADPYLLNVNNGTLDLRTGELCTHKPTDYIRSIVPVDYDAAAACPQWLAFLDRIMDGSRDIIDYLQRAIGYTLTGNTAEQCLFFCYGVGRNGKSVYLETIQKLTGEYGLNCRTETLMARRNDGIPNDVARLAGARFVAVNETAEGQKLNEPLIKDMTGGDSMTARFLRREYFDFHPIFKLWMRGNHKPQIRGTDEGIWRRIHLIPFQHYITDDECDVDLAGKLRGELPGILAWAVEGCSIWQRDGLNPPAAVTDATKEYRSEMDVLGQFIDDRCVVAVDANQSAGALYKDYQKWAETPVNRTAFGLAFAERGYTKKKNRRGNNVFRHRVAR